MKCGQCGGKVRVMETEQRSSGLLWRRRECKGCGWRFSTYEILVDDYNRMDEQARKWASLIMDLNTRVTDIVMEGRHPQ